MEAVFRSFSVQSFQKNPVRMSANSRQARNRHPFCFAANIRKRNLDAQRNFTDEFEHSADGTDT